MQVLVTGAAGYIGSICTEVLMSSGFAVVALDNLVEGSRSAVPSAAQFYQADCGDGACLDEIFERHQIDAVMHFAGEALVEKSMNNPSVFYVTNIARGIALLDAMIRHRVNHFVFSSTCAVYGETAVVPIPEDHAKLPVNPYGKSKLIFEEILADYHKFAGLDYVSLRYFNVAGASRDRGECRRHETHVIPLLIQAIASGQTEFPVFGTDYPTPDGTCVRDYVHVLDVAHAHLQALRSIARIGEGSFNVGTGVGHSIREVLNAVRLVTGSKISEKVFPRRPGDPAILVASGEKMRSELGWQPSCSSLAEIVKSAWLWKLSHPQGWQSRPQAPSDSFMAST